MKSKISAAARSEILALLQRQMYVSADQAAEVLEKYGVSGDDETLQKRYRKRLCQQLMASIRDEDGHRQVLALCDTKGGAEYIIIDCCNDPVKLEKIWYRLNGQMTGLDNTFDAYLYQLVENKQRFIAQIMTSKSPARVADDIDETALSYSEIKALATGNPLIIEKCNLDMEVTKLNVLKASHLSQKYALENMVFRKYPETIQRLQERIACYEQDVQLAAKHPKQKEGFAGMEIQGKHYTDKEAAGKAIIDVCTKMTSSEAVEMGQYRGFALSLAYDSTKNEYHMRLKGTMTHATVLGVDVFGNITRMDNVIDGLTGKLETVRDELRETEKQLENARAEMETPFAKEAELTEKTARLKELNILLNMDQKDCSLIDDVPEDTASERARSKERER